MATVSDTSEVSAVGAGDATITATEAAQPTLSASATIHVRTIAEDTGIEILQTSLSVKAGEEASVKAYLAPSLAGAAVTWSVEPANLATVVAGTDTTSATLTGGDHAGTGTLSASVTSGARPSPRRSP